MINVKKYLNEKSDSFYADFNRKFIKTQYPILGVRLPILRKFAKDVEPEYIELEQNLSHEEILLYGYSAGLCKSEDEQLEYLKNILPYIDNWCTCDCIVSSLKKLTGEKSYIFFTNLLLREKEFFIRVGIIGLMRYFMKTKHLQETLKNIKEISSNAYYVQMATAWFYAELCVFNIETAKSEIKTLDDKFIRNKAISKAKESFRVTKEDKEELEKLRIK